MSKILEFKTRSKQLADWFDEVVNRNGLLEQNVQSALFLWKTKNKDDSSICMHAKYNCDNNNFEWFKKCMEDQSFKNKVADYLKENIKEFVGYID